MNRYEVRDALLAAGLPPAAFVVEGLHEPVPAPPDHWFLRQRAGEWEVGPYERGAHEIRLRTPDEAAACDLLYRALTGT